MKRFFAGLLVVGMMGTVLTGCKSQGTDSASGNAAADASGTETTVLVLANSAPASEDNHMYQYCEKFKELVEEKVGVKFLSWGVNGFRHFCNNIRPVKSPEDIRGLKVRTMENKIHMEAFSALGADPTPMGTGELYTALQQGTVDGMEGPLTWILPSKYNEVQKYMSLTSHFYAPSAALMNQAKFDGLPEDVRTILEESAEEAESYQLQFCRDIDKQMAEEAAEAGMEVIPESELDMDGFREAVQGVYDAHPEYAQILQKIKETE